MGCHNVVSQVSTAAAAAVSLNRTNFDRHYNTRLPLPCPVLRDSRRAGRALCGAVRQPHGGGPGGPIHALLSRTASRRMSWATCSATTIPEGEEAFFSPIRLPVYRGVSGIESRLDESCGAAPASNRSSSTTSAIGRRENVWSAAEPGRDVVLTIDLDLQRRGGARAANASPARTTRGAVVVMDVHTGDILALVSSPDARPELVCRGGVTQQGMGAASVESRAPTTAQPRHSAASTTRAPFFKIVVGLAGLEAGR